MTMPLSEAGLAVEQHWRELASRRRLYTAASLFFLFIALSGSLWFANDSNAGKFFDRLPHFFDFVGHLIRATASKSGAPCSTCPRPMPTAA
jgi:phosphonate transport system permease protein